MRERSRNYRSHRDEFHRDFDFVQKLFLAIWVASVLAIGAGIFGIAYVVYKVLVHFGIF